MLPLERIRLSVLRLLSLVFGRFHWEFHVGIVYRHVNKRVSHNSVTSLMFVVGCKTTEGVLACCTVAESCATLIAIPEKGFVYFTPLLGHVMRQHQ